MNTYNENLQNTVLASLQSQELDQKDLNAQFNASKFTLYYAQGATITAYENLVTAKDNLNFKTSVNNEAVRNTNIGNNLLSSATQANQYLSQSASNTAICASNVQIAATAITRLASDVGSVFSIVNAADFDTDIYTLTEEVHRLINETAYDAEYTSQVAMDASMLTSEVSSSTVLDNTKTTIALMNNVLSIASADYATASQIVATDNTVLATASANEKLAEGELEAINIDYNAAKSAYKSINQGLNLDLQVDTKSDKTSGTASDPDAATTFIVKFNPIVNPFTNDGEKPSNPVQYYNILVVKESKKLTFTLSEAENIVHVDDNKLQFVRVNYSPASQVVQDPKIQKPINYMKIYAPQVLQDSDGDAMKQGVKYVVFVMGVYKDDYKRKINDFDDFLSAPSLPFSLTTHLERVKSGDIHVASHKSSNDDKDEIKHEQAFEKELKKVLKDSIRMSELSSSDSNKQSKYTHKITFSVKENLQYVAYRCIFLPKADLGKGLLTKSSLDAFIKKENTLEEIANTYDPRIADLQAQLVEVQLQQQHAPETEAGKLASSHSKISDEIKSLIKIKEEDIKDITDKKQQGPGFFFDRALAEQVPSGNYIPAVAYEPKDKKGKEKASEIEATEKHYVAYIGTDVTDNFGNMLVDGNHYIPVVLAVATVEEENMAQYTSSMSNINNVKSFIYHEQI